MMVDRWIDAAGWAVALLGVANLTAALAVIAFSRPLSRRTAPCADAAADPQARAPGRGELPFVSVHVATHDEPPALVIATIEALAQLDYPAFEIIVIDNNTPDPATWQPVAARAQALGPKVRFVHRDGVKGAKAGALNIALDMADPRARFVAVVDADYQVSPGFLRRAVAAFRPGVAFVQFPQAYRHAERAGAITAELSDYFHTFPSLANRAQATLLTGTLSVIAIDALRQAGNWPTGSITEDAELGVRLWANGAGGLFISEEVGRGLLPLDLAGLRLQRGRWAGGNMQTLIGAWRSIAQAPRGGIEVIAQLTAWTGFCAVPLVSLLLAAALRLTDAAASRPSPSSWLAVEAVAALTLACVLAAHAVRALMRQRPTSLAVTLALLWTSSFGWLSAIGGRSLRFRRTPKAPALGAARQVGIDTLGGIAALAAAAILATSGSLFAPVVLVLSATGLATAPLVDAWLRRAARSLPQEGLCAA